MKQSDKDHQADMYQEQRAEQSAMDNKTEITINGEKHKVLGVMSSTPIMDNESVEDIENEFKEELKQKMIIKANQNIESTNGKCTLCGVEIEDSEDRCQDCFEEWGNGWPDR